MARLNDLPQLRSSLKRSRSPELKLQAMRSASHDDVLTDNMRAQKRYFSQVMATDLDKLKVAGPVNSEVTACLRGNCSHETTNDASMCSSSMMSGDESCNTATPQSKRQRHLRPLEVPDSTSRDSASSLSHSVTESALGSARRIAQQTPKGQRFRNEHDKPPISPNDPCLGMDLRKAALLRSLMLATDPPKQISARQGPASNTRHASRMQQQCMLANCDRMSDGNASTDMDVSMHSDAECSPSVTPSVSPDRIKAISTQLADPALLPTYQHVSTSSTMPCI